MIHSVAEKARISLAYLEALLEPIGQETASKVFLLRGKTHVLITFNYREEGLSAITAKAIMGSFLELQDPEGSGRRGISH